MPILHIHFEGFRDDTVLDYLLQSEHPVAFSLAPFTLEEHWYPDDTLEKLTILLSRPGNFLGQQGKLHKCAHTHKIADPWHENFCPWNGKIPENQQRELMEQGREILQRHLDISPSIYVPPNHLFDETTLEVATSMGYRFFTDQSFLRLHPYTHKNMTVVPESKVTRIRTKTVYAHYDEVTFLRSLIYQLINEGLKPFNSAYPHTPYRTFDHEVNEKLKRAYKRIRDLGRIASLAK